MSLYLSALPTLSLELVWAQEHSFILLSSSQIYDKDWGVWTHAKWTREDLSLSAYTSVLSSELIFTFFYLKNYYLFYVYGVLYVCSDHGAWKREEDPLEQEL